MEFTPEIPESGLHARQQACIWMSAGVVSHQLCDRKFTCESCPLDAAMRMHRSRVSADGTRRLHRAPILAADCLYTRSHCWVRNFGEKVRVGIEAGLATILPQPATVVLPAAQTALHLGQTCVWLTNAEELFRLRAPIDGTICAVHDNIGQRWHLLRDDPFSAGWLYEISATSERVESARLMNVEEAMQEYGEDARKFKALVAQAAAIVNGDQREVMQDGGELMPNATEIIGNKKYLSIVHEVFGI